jgi:2-(3-amino-3-carboxypropyl)histidine synthase
MKTYTLNELNEKYDLELDRILREIKKKRAKRVLLQFPEGLKVYATSVVDYLKEQAKGKVEFVIWMDTCFGACDIPVGVEGFDIVIQFGHSEMMPSY